MKKTKDTNITIRVSSEQKEELKVLATKQNTSLTKILLDNSLNK